MPYGAAGGLAAGLAQGMELGNQAAEVRSRRLALLQQQAQEKITQTTGYVREGLKTLETIVSSQAQRSPELEQTVNAYKDALTSAALSLKALPGGAEAAQYTLQTINSIVPNLKTAGELHAAKVLGEFQGTKSAMGTIAGAPAAAPAAPAPGVQTASGPATPGATPAPAPAAGTAAPAQPDAMSRMPSDAAIMNSILGIDNRDSEATTQQKNKLATTRGAAISLFQQIDKYQSMLKEYGLDAARPGSEASMLVDQMRSNIVMQLKEFFALGALQAPDIAQLDRLIFNPSNISNITDVVGRGQKSNDALKDYIYSTLQGVEAGQTSGPVADPRKQQEGGNQQMAAPEGGGIGSGAVAGEQEFEVDDDGWVILGPGLRLRAKPGAQ